jgi:hypothetical protein
MDLQSYNRWYDYSRARCGVRGDWFVDSGWDFGGDFGAAAKTRTQGGQVSAGASAQGIEIYQFTDRGLELAATVADTKYWQDEELNTGRNR